eukprot:scaffold798_cov367-Pavlova_lutheri.AAC.26
METQVLRSRMSTFSFLTVLSSCSTCPNGAPMKTQEGGAGAFPRECMHHSCASARVGKLRGWERGSPLVSRTQ